MVKSEKDSQCAYIDMSDTFQKPLFKKSIKIASNCVSIEEIKKLEFSENFKENYTTNFKENSTINSTTNLKENSTEKHTTNFKENSTKNSITNLKENSTENNTKKFIENITINRTTNLKENSTENYTTNFKENSTKNRTTNLKENIKKNNTKNSATHFKKNNTTNFTEFSEDIIDFSDIFYSELDAASISKNSNPLVKKYESVKMKKIENPKKRVALSKKNINISLKTNFKSVRKNYNEKTDNINCMKSILNHVQTSLNNNLTYSNLQKEKNGNLSDAFNDESLDGLLFSQEDSIINLNKVSSHIKNEKHVNNFILPLNQADSTSDNQKSYNEISSLKKHENSSSDNKNKHNNILSLKKHANSTHDIFLEDTEVSHCLISKNEFGSKNSAFFREISVSTKIHGTQTKRNRKTCTKELVIQSPIIDRINHILVKEENPIFQDSNFIQLSNKKKYGDKNESTKSMKINNQKILKKSFHENDSLSLSFYEFSNLISGVDIEKKSEGFKMKKHKKESSTLQPEIRTNPKGFYDQKRPIKTKIENPGLKAYAAASSLFYENSSQNILSNNSLSKFSSKNRKKGSDRDLYKKVLPENNKPMVFTNKNFINTNDSSKIFAPKHSQNSNLSLSLKKNTTSSDIHQKKFKKNSFENSISLNESFLNGVVDDFEQSNSNSTKIITKTKENFNMKKQSLDIVSIETSFIGDLKNFRTPQFTKDHNTEYLFNFNFDSLKKLRSSNDFISITAIYKTEDYHFNAKICAIVIGKLNTYTGLLYKLADENASINACVCNQTANDFSLKIGMRIILKDFSVWRLEQPCINIVSECVYSCV